MSAPLCTVYSIWFHFFVLGCFVQRLPRFFDSLTAALFRRAAQLVKKDFDKLVDGGASSPARCRVSNLRFEPSAVSPSAKPENPLGFQPSCHPYQFLLKSFRFPGAKTARKRFLLWKMGFSAAKILPCPPYMPLGTIEIREGFGPLELSKGFSTV